MYNCETYSESKSNVYLLTPDSFPVFMPPHQKIGGV